MCAESVAGGFFEFDVESPSWTDLNSTFSGSFTPSGRCSTLVADGNGSLYALTGGDNEAELLAGGACRVQSLSNYKCNFH
jgi:hypothetical protein